MTLDQSKSPVTDTLLRPFTFGWFLSGFLASIYYGLVIQGLASLSQATFWSTAIQTTGAMLAVFYLLLELAYRGSKREAGPLVQLRLNSLFLWITAAAFCLSMFRSYVNAFAANRETIQISDVVGAMLVMVAAALLSLPFVIWLGSFLMWGATKILRIPSVKKLVQRWHARKEPPS